MDMRSFQIAVPRWATYQAQDAGWQVKGEYKIPHSIRIDPAGNVWTVDAASSVVIKYSPLGEKRMTIVVGEQPEGRGGFNGTTDIAFGPQGRLFITDGYGNARVLESLPMARECSNGVSAAPVRENFGCRTPFRSTRKERSTSPTGRTAESRSSISTADSSARFHILGAFTR
jgi:hypothetical protein